MNGYTKTTWVDNSTPAINAENLNHIEQGIKDVTDEVIGGTIRFVDVTHTSETDADNCTTPNTLYYVWVNSYNTTGVQNAKQYVMCTPEWYGTKTQYSFTRQGKIIFRTYSNSAWGDWAAIPTQADVTAAVSDKVDVSTYNADLGEIEGQLLQMEDTSNKVTQITGNETNTQYPSAPAVVAYVNAAIAAALNG